MKRFDDCWMRFVAMTGLGAVLAAAVVVSTSPRSSQATPAYARRYAVECVTCHSPNPPRLNNVGMMFRRAGFRLPDADEQGNLKFKSNSASTIGDAAAIAVQMDGQHLQTAAPGTSRTSAQVSEVELIFGTAVGERYSTQMLFIPYDDTGGSHVENAEVQANYGKPEQLWTLRAGLAQPLIWQKSIHGSMTLSSPLILAEAPVAPVGSFGGVGLGTMQAEVEAGYSLNRLSKGKLMSTMVSVAALNGFNEDGSGARTHQADGSDFLAQAVQLFGSRNTVNAFYYDGHIAAPPATFRNRFNRMGVTANYAPIERIDLAAGFAQGEDKSDELARTVKDSGGYGEITGEVMPHWVAVYRFDQVDPDKDTADDTIQSHVLSSTYLLQSTVFFTLEYQETKQGSVKQHTYSARVRFLY